MKQILPFLIFCLSSNFSYAQHLIKNSSKVFGADTIIWNENYHLTVSDFKAKPHGAFADGASEAGIGLDLRMDSSGIHIITYTFFLCNYSFITGGSIELLQHEQLHFDIDELYARKMRQQILQKDLSKKINVNSTVNKIYNQVYAEYKKEQILYDKETKHGTDYEKQNQWQLSIQNKLKEMERYQLNEILID